MSQYLSINDFHAMAYKGVGVLFGVLSFFYFTTALKDSVSGGT